MHTRPTDDNTWVALRYRIVYATCPPNATTTPHITHRPGLLFYCILSFGLLSAMTTTNKLEHLWEKNPPRRWGGGVKLGQEKKRFPWHCCWCYWCFCCSLARVCPEVWSWTTATIAHVNILVSSFSTLPWYFAFFPYSVLLDFKGMMSYSSSDPVKVI